MKRIVAGLVILAVLCAGAAAAQNAGAFKAGFARVDITPEPGCQIPGGFSKNIAEGVHDPLYVEAAVFMNGGVELAIAGVDAIMVSDDTVAEARKLAESACGIPGANILIGASHTHNGGPVVDCLGSDRDPAYCHRLAEAIAKAVADARAAAVDAQLGVGVGREDSVSFNRRFKMKDGTEKTHPGRMNTDIVEPAGPMDPDVAVIAVENMQGDLLGCIVNHALHGTAIGGSNLSADWIGYMRQTIRGGVGRDMGVVFINGACGDVTQVDNRNPRPPEFGEAWARRVGMTIGAEALKVIARTEYSPDVPLAVKAESLDLPIRDLAESDEALVARETPASGLGAAQNEAYLREAGLVRARKAESPTARVEVQAMRIGSAAIATNPMEYFCALGLAIKNGSPWKPTLVAELANGYAGYSPTKQAFAGGGYEVRTARSSFLAPGTGEEMAAVAVRLLKSLAGENQ
ncbi:MAG: hypothetical protein NTZ09_04815 [Candidatus Hydrogenedentes bacterium]|nr:hypothetical protein [Candidatus Hydrogenedentota bacterium]